MSDTSSASSESAAARLPFLTLTNWVRSASRCGFNIEPVFRDVGVQTDLIHLESATVSIETLRMLMEACVARAQQHHFPFVLGETFAFEYIPDVETFLTTSPTLREAFRVFEWIRLLINPLIGVSLDEAGSEARLLVRFDVGEQAHAELAHQHFLEATFSAVVKFVRELMAGSQGAPTLLTFRCAPPYNSIDYAAYFKMPVRFGQRDDALILDRGLLDLPLSGAFPALHKQAEYRVEQRIAQSAARPGLVAHVEQIFMETPILLGQGIEAMAQRLQLHPRTLQRRLQEHGVRYTTLQAQVRFRLSSQWLQEDEVSVETISERLGFCDRRSFTQAFKRWSGLSPSQFRGKSRSD